MKNFNCNKCGKNVEAACDDCKAGITPKVPIEERIPFVPQSVEPDGDKFIAKGQSFTNLQESFDYAFGATEDEARKNYNRKLHSISDLQQAIADADRFYHENIKPFFENFTIVKESLLEIVGEGHYFQDVSGIVFKTTIPKGAFVSFQKAGIERTKREGERAGSLSMKEAKEAGFTNIPEFKEAK